MRNISVIRLFFYISLYIHIMLSYLIIRTSNRHFVSINRMPLVGFASYAYRPSIIRSIAFHQKWRTFATGSHENHPHSNNNNIAAPDNLRNYLQTTITAALKKYDNHNVDQGSNEINQIATSMIDNMIQSILADPKISNASELNQSLASRGEDLARVLEQYKLHINQDCTLHDILSHHITIDNMFQTCHTYQQKNQKVYKDITSHHWKLKSDSAWLSSQLTSSSLSSDALQTYGNAAALMGSKQWVREGNEWLMHYSYNFFCRNGARRSYINAQLQKLLLQTANKSKDGMKMTQVSKLASSSSEEIGRHLPNNVMHADEKIRLLDVGSCYNPLASLSNSDAYSITAIDLYPMSMSVLECDFLNLTVSSPGTSPIISDGKLTHLPAESYDVVTLSLVLSYLPTPDLRLDMIKRARQLLVSPGYGGHPHRAGILLIVEKPSIFQVKQNRTAHTYASMIHAWKQSIQECGFDLLNYKLLEPELSHTSRDSRSHVFAFKTSNNTNNHDISSHRLWIRQDFTTSDDKLNISTSSTSPTINNVISHKPIISHSHTYSKDPHCQPLVAVIGGGLGGVALGLSLQQRNIPVKIFERDTSFHARKQGYALTMQQAITTLRSLGLRREIVNIGVRSYAHQSFLWDGKVIGCYGPLVRNGIILEDKYTNWPHNKIVKDDLSQEMINIEDFTDSLLQRSFNNRHNIHVPRQTVREILLQDVDSNNICWNKRLISYDEDENHDHISLKFDDGEVVTASVAVAADGIYSTIRSQMLSTATRDLNYLGLMVILGISYIDANPILFSATSFVSAGKIFRKQVQWVDGSVRVFTMPYDDKKIMWQLSFPIDEKIAQEIAHQGSEALKATAMKQCGHWDPVLCSLIDTTDHDDISGHAAYDRDPITSSELAKYRDIRSRMTFLGDAAHPMSPFKGQGANQALLDALDLANVISASNIVSSDRQPIAAALRLYEENMLRRSADKVLKSRTAAVYLHSDAALTQGNITRAMAAEMAQDKV